MHIESINASCTLIVNQKKRESVKIECVYSYGGSFYEEKGERGRRHLLEHCIVSRTKDMNDTQFKEWSFEYNVDRNAYTSPDIINIHATMNKEDYALVIPYILEQFFTPVFEQGILEREKEIVLRELSEYHGDPQYQLSVAVGQQTLTEHSLDRHEVLGEVDDVASTTLEDLKKTFAKILKESHLYILVNGDVEIATIRKCIKKYVPLPSQNRPLPHSFVNEFIFEGIKKIIHPLAHEQCSMSYSIPTLVTHNNRDVRELFYEYFLGWNGSGLADYLRDELGLIYGYSTYFDLPSQSLRIDLTCEIERIERIHREIEVYFTDLHKRWDDAQWLRLQHKIIRKYKRMMDSLSMQSQFWLNSMLQFGIAETIEEFTKRVERVHAESVKAFYVSLEDSLKKARIVLVSRDERLKEMLS